MSKQLFANEKVMTQYLGALLCEDEPVDNLEPVAKLLEQVTDKKTEHPDLEAQSTQSTPVFEQVVPEIIKKPIAQEVKALVTSAEQTLSAEQILAAQSQADYFDGQFQALFFEVAGLTLAVPLKALGLSF